jgi:hypothetical protein
MLQFYFQACFVVAKNELHLASTLPCTNSNTKHRIGNQHRWSQQLSGYRAVRITHILPLKNGIALEVLAVLRNQGTGHHFDCHRTKEVLRNHVVCCWSLLGLGHLCSQFWSVSNVSNRKKCLARFRLILAARSGHGLHSKVP